LLVRVFSKKEVNTFKGIWRHPAKGTGQICDTLAQGILDGGGRIHYESKVLEIGAADGVVNTVTAEVASETVVYKPRYLVSSIPLEFLMKLLFPATLRSLVQGGPGLRRGAKNRGAGLSFPK
jgi:phytoene dehydrogenase-like protein